jgi:hypothetical protein
MLCILKNVTNFEPIKENTMTVRDNTGMKKSVFVVMFVISLIATLAFLFASPIPEWFWVCLPTLTAGLTGSLDSM